MKDNDKLQFVIDKLQDIDVNICFINEKLNKILEIMENSNNNHYNNTLDYNS